MSLEQALHQRWQDDAALTALLPTARFVTGLAHGAPRLPYATLKQLDSRPTIHTSSGTVVSQTTVRLSIWSSDLDAGQQIATQADRVFNRSAFDCTLGRVLNMQRLHALDEAHADGAWRLALDYVITHENQPAS